MPSAIHSGINTTSTAINPYSSTSPLAADAGDGALRFGRGRQGARRNQTLLTLAGLLPRGAGVVRSPRIPQRVTRCRRRCCVFPERGGPDRTDEQNAMPITKMVKAITARTTLSGSGSFMPAAESDCCLRMQWLMLSRSATTPGEAVGTALLKFSQRQSGGHGRAVGPCRRPGTAGGRPQRNKRCGLRNFSGDGPLAGFRQLALIESRLARANSI